MFQNGREIVVVPPHDQQMQSNNNNKNGWESLRSALHVNFSRLRIERDECTSDETLPDFMTSATPFWDGETPSTNNKR
ncbi:Hypothetical protein NTJ_11557 [Nesidiocoris tenuis]|uniref:Uncharacterized protein n=1 Tax=Nesidiocoris tenuis TaxID=355587 RepID=A0ABN7B2W6_9HEMI|nr:Hypothetical protein NTJ_11557 [Nesidiocoris tenuis]